ncbi:O-linked N-acetylglucosamine transferase family protein [Rhizobium oryzicola]|uniref:protein O-GlcNAc transferase n=1 Tax=Rhizobium oryzicola TaxID=1232668 RepID=A0ABT8SUU1_9HYPH|nr:glycosyl transferase [Rhizobium oryzicola]MDO1582212.1 glycosyl transferase [Rhizobium oryzicola]
MGANLSNVTEDASPLAGFLEQAKAQDMSVATVFQVAESLNTAGLKQQAIEIYKTWLAYNEGNPLRHLVYFNYSVTLRQAGDLAGSIEALRSCVEVNPDFAPGHINLGRALEDAGLVGRAILQWQSYAEKTAEVTADKIKHRHMVLQHIGRVLENSEMLDQAEAVLWQAIEMQPHKSEAGQHWTALRQRQCKWPILTPSEHVTHRQLIDMLSPLAFSCYLDDPLFHLAKSYRYSQSLIGRPDTRDFPRKAPRRISGTNERLRVGYLSSDLREHAVGFALVEVLELHDKQKVEVFAYYCGDPRPASDETHQRIRTAVDHWRDIAGVSDADAARQISADGIDVLIDVNGFTKHARTKIFAYRPAPVIVNFCGYPGSMANPYHQYMIADNFIVPPENEIYYTEKVLRIACNQPVDRKRKIAPKPTREEAGLPDDAFVYVSFNGMQKITQECFARWMAILNATPGSVLWLLGSNDIANNRLREEAEKAGVDPQRLIFAPKASNPQHLARIGLADLFLDTFPYGAHSTAADAITMGVPIVTMPGKTFASRFCASIVHSAGVPELICNTADEYVNLAVNLERDRQSLKTIRESIQRQRETCALRDMPGLARRLEELYWQMQGECERGETPAPDLTNLDLYYEIGAELVAAGPENEDESSYRARYRAKLAEWDAISPLPRDARLWN